MKNRQGFVSNSSSSSFIIFKRDLNDEQIRLIKEHYSVSEKLCEQGTSLNLYSYEESWSITETDLTIEGSTWMDNFSMSEYLEYIVIVDDEHIRWN